MEDSKPFSTSIKGLFDIRSLSNKYLFWLIPTIVVSLLIFGRYLFIFQKEDTLAANRSIGELITRQTNRALIRWVEDQIALATGIAEDPRVVDLCLDPSDMEARKIAQVYLTEKHKKYPYFENIPIAIKLGSSQKLKQVVNGKVKEIHDGNFFIDTVNGVTIGKGDPELSYIKSIYDGKPHFISEVHLSFLTNDPIFVISTPVKHNGRTIGVVVLPPRIDYFTQFFIEGVILGKTGYLFMTDKSGRVISHPNKELILREKVAEMPPNYASISENITTDQKYFMEHFDNHLKVYVVAKFPTKNFHLHRDWYMVFCREYNDILEGAYAIFQNMVGVVIVVTFFVASIIFLLTYHMISRPLGKLKAIAHDVAEGDLNVEIPMEESRDEIGLLHKAIREMTADLRAQCNQILAAVNILNASTSDISAISMEQESSLAEHEASTIKVAVSAKEISTKTAYLATTMEGIQKVALCTYAIADSSRIGLVEMGKNMHQLGKATGSFKEKLAVINENSENIDGVVTTITKIANQANLLSLNASIEAEKAGEFGQGFGMIAREIRTLADQVASATMDIESMIKEMRISVLDGVGEMDAFSKELEKGVSHVEKVGQELADIIGQVKDLTPKFTRVNESMGSQAQGVKEISATITDLSKGAKTSSASIAKLNKSVEQLRCAADNLFGEVSRFKV